MPTKIGLMVGREWSLPPAFVEEVHRRDEGVSVEYVKLGTPTLRDPVQYSVIIDRISHEVPFYRTYLKNAAMRGVRVINPPSTWLLDDRFTLAARALDLGISTPRTVVLPHREYAEGIVHEESLRNLDYPLDWSAVVEHVGLPCLLKDAKGGGEPTYVCNSLEELLHHFNESGQGLLVAQEIIPWQQFVRCFVIGGKEVLPVKYDPGERRYLVDHAHLSRELGRRIVDESLRLVRNLGFDVNTVDWAIRDGVPYAVEMMNPVPDIDIYGLTPDYFDWVVQKMADHAVGLATRVGARTAAAGGRKSDRDGAGDLAEEFPSLARGLPDTEL